MFQSRPQMFRQENPAYSSKMRLAQSLLERGTDSSPVSSDLEIAARLAQALSGAYVQDKALTADKADRTDAMKALAEGMSAKPWDPSVLVGEGPPEKIIAGVPGAPPAVDEDGYEMEPQTIPHALAMQNAAPAGGYAGGIAALLDMSDNPYAGRYAQSLMAGQMGQQAEALKAERALRNAQTLKMSPGYETSPASVKEYEFAQQNGYTGSFEEFKQISGSGGQEKFGNSPIWGTDANGNPVLMQPSNRGGVKQVDLPPGVTPQRGQTQRIDLGNEIAILDANGQFIARVPKGIAPDRKIDDGRVVTLPGVPGGPVRGMPQSQKGSHPQTPAASFDPEGGDYDYARARSVGMGPDGTGENEGHWGSVATTTPAEQRQHGLPSESYLILKGRNHPTFDKAVAGEEARGFKVVKRGERYYSVPADAQNAPMQPPASSMSPGGVSVTELPPNAAKRGEVDQIASEAEYSIRLIDALIDHPGMTDVVGMPGSVSGFTTKAFGTPLPDTDAAGFHARLKQIEGKQFLQAFQSLKGGGHITEIEGQKATEAMSRLTQTGQKEEEYRQAAEELKQVLRTGAERAKNALRGSAPAGEAGNRNPAPGGIKFLGFE